MERYGEGQTLFVMSGLAVKTWGSMVLEGQLGIRRH